MLLRALASLVTLILKGKAPSQLRPFFWRLTIRGCAAGQPPGSLTVLSVDPQIVRKAEIWGGNLLSG